MWNEFIFKLYQTVFSFDLPRPGIYRSLTLDDLCSMVPGVAGEEVALWVCLWVTTSLKRKMSRWTNKLMINRWWFWLDKFYCHLMIPILDEMFVIQTFGGFQLGGGFVDLLVLRSPRQWVFLRGGWRLHPGKTLIIWRWRWSHDLWWYLKWW